MGPFSRFCAAAIATSGCAAGCAPGAVSGRPRACMPYQSRIRPVLAGDTVRLAAGTVVGGLLGDECDRRRPVAARWASPDTGVVRITPAGLVRAVAPGVFRVTAAGAGGEVLRDSGFVLPPGWSVRVHPASAVVRVGDSVSFRVVAVDAGGRDLPPVPASLYTAEMLARMMNAGDTPEAPPGPRPPTVEASRQLITGPGVFHGARPGTTTITGVIGPAMRPRAEARLTVVPADGPR